MCQGSEAATLLGSSGRHSAKGGSRRTRARCSFATGRAKSKEAKAMHCPAEPVVAGYFTKPLQGKLFFKFRSMAMGASKESLEAHQRCSGEATERCEELKKEPQAAWLEGSTACILCMHVHAYMYACYT